MTDIFDAENINAFGSGFASTSPSTKPAPIPVAPVSVSRLTARTNVTGPIPAPPDPQQIASRMGGGSSEGAAVPVVAPPQALANSGDIFDKEGIAQPTTPPQANSFGRGVVIPNGQQNAVADQEQAAAAAYAQDQMQQAQALGAKRFTPDQLTDFAKNPVTIAQAIQSQQDWPDVPSLLQKSAAGEALTDVQRNRLNEYIDTTLETNLRGMSWNGNRAVVGQQLPAHAVQYVNSGESGAQPTLDQLNTAPTMSGNAILPAPYSPKAGEKPLNDFMAVTDKGQQLMAQAKDKPASAALKSLAFHTPDGAAAPAYANGQMISSVNDLPANLKAALYDVYKQQNPKATMSETLTPSGWSKAVDTIGESKASQIISSFFQGVSGMSFEEHQQAKWSGGVLPVSKDQAGNTRLDWRSGLTSFILQPGDVASGKIKPGTPEFDEAAMNVGMGILTGEIGAKVPEQVRAATAKAGKVGEEEASTPQPETPPPTVDDHLDVLTPNKDQTMVDNGSVSIHGADSSPTRAAEFIMQKKGLDEAQAKEVAANLTANEKDQFINQNIKAPEGSYPVQPAGIPIEDRTAAVSEQLSQAHGVDIALHDTEEGLRLSAIKVNEAERGQGIGSAAMQDIVNYADQEGKRISLTPTIDFGASSVSRLAEFYKRFGFVENKGKNAIPGLGDTMYRDPVIAAAGTPVNDVATAVGDSQAKAMSAKEPPPIDDSESSYNALHDRLAYMYRRLVNTLSPIEKAEARARERGAEIKPGQSPTLLSNLYGNVGAIINHYLGLETFRWTEDGMTEVTGKGLKAIMDDFDNIATPFEKVREARFKDFNDYLLAQRYAELEKAGEGKVKPEQAKWAKDRLDQLSDKYQDHLNLIENLAQEVYAFQRRTLDVLVDNGVISAETRDMLNSKYQRYVPLDRVFTEEEMAAGKGKRGLGKYLGKFSGAGPQGIIQKLKGSEREAREPLRNIYERTHIAIDRAYRNRVARSVDSLKDILPEYIQVEKPRIIKKGKAEVKITHDPVLDKKLDAAIEHFKHTTERSPSVKVKGFRNVLGSYDPMEKLIRTKLGANEAVKTHEVGHMLDYELGLGQKLLKDKEIKAELKRLAEERIGKEAALHDSTHGPEFVEERHAASDKFKAYIRNDREVIANMYDAYVNAPELLDKYAPKAKAAFEKLLDERDDLKFIKDIKPSLIRDERTIERDVWGEAPELPPNTIAVYKNGERSLLRVSKPMYEALTQLGPARVGFLERFLKGTFGLSAKMLRTGATSTISFIERNVFRDQMDAMIQGGVGYKAPWDFSKGLFQAFGHGELYNNWVRSGGKMHFMQLGDNGMELSYKEMFEGEGRFKQLLEAAPRFSEKFEQATRIGLFNAAKRKGLSDLEASMASLEGTLNFGRGGDVIRKANQYVPFLNAGVQATDKLIRTAYNHPKMTMLWGVGTVTLPTLAITGYYLYGADEKTRQEYLEIPQWQKDMFWTVKIGDEWRSFPKPFSWGYMFGSIPERVMLANYQGQKPEAKHMWMDVMRGLFGTLSPVNDWSALMVPMIKVVAEWQSNYNFFMGKSIYPEWMNDLPPEQRANAYTSQTAKLIGKATGQSPALIENSIRDLTGGVGGYGLKAGDAILDGVKRWNGEPVSEKPPSDADNILMQGFTVRDPIGTNSTSVQNFFDNYKEAKQAHLGLKNVPEDQQDAYTANRQQQLDGYKDMEAAHKQLTKLNKQIISIYNDTSMSGAEKKQQIRELGNQMTDIAREANLNYNAAAQGETK